ncbi:MAG TPA: hypothetical protein VFE36_04450, partial [Candidatus Baltobacteraceae bacterium]|nr:hypothetical protein [Candidatus Baltobacteraceae bacterium]
MLALMLLTTLFPVGRSTLRASEATATTRGDATGSLGITLWYPAAERSVATEHVIGPPNDPLFDAGLWQEHAALATGRFPLIAFSHGTGGSALQMAWFATGLAARGFIVVAVDHPGNSLDTYTPAGFGLWWLRPGDVSLALSTALADPTLGPAIDANRIGAAGFSLGGYTVLELGGARTDLKRFAGYCRRTHWK